ncbi:MAG: acetyl-CoA carboxylase biotin carboxyl carrier protein [Defluviitaleaceae bacterium]|nr:acetyl-CoA carboxylase biotin carboxyl carrier protein [Defluviitaleaceae bacterium]
MKIIDIEYINNAAELLNRNGLSKVEINDSKMRVVIEKNSGGVVQTVQTAPAAFVIENNNSPIIQTEEVIDFNSMIEVTSPIVGVFYSSPSPEAEPFVTIGSTVKAGDVLCVIEAMKCFNDIPAAQDGKIVDICLKNGDVVEFGQVLFKMQ